MSIEVKPKTEAHEAVNPVGPSHFTEGLTKREYFAAMALQGLLANEARSLGYTTYYSFAAKAAKAADDLIEALNQ